ncbi:MAG TPA: peptidylprolyl isomerase [Candidatus Levybacteria bacterium]|nr:peptidylprolyl isomerase [Candidatus Levybacteria bacterium]
MTKVVGIIIIALFIGLGLIIFFNQNPPAPESQNLVRSDTQTTPFQAPEIPTSPTVPAGPTPDTSVLQATESSKAIIKTSKGNITVELFNAEAKRAVENFYVKSQTGFYNNLRFHRVEDWVIQGGDPRGNGTGGGNMPSEYNQKPFITGSLGMARGADKAISNDSQFFITKTPADWLNGEYINFGTVIEGIAVVKNIEIGDVISGVEFVNN